MIKNFSKKDFTKFIYHSNNFFSLDKIKITRYIFLKKQNFNINKKILIFFEKYLIIIII